MPLAIPGSPLTVTLTASSINTTVYVDAVDYTILTRKFDRKEFSNAYLRNLKEVDGSEAIYVKNATGKLIQVNYSCGSYTARPIIPDDNNIGKILQKMIIKRYMLRGGPTAISNLSPLFNVAYDHEERLDLFQSYLDSLGLEISITYALALQSQNFSYLTTTGLNFAGVTMNESNCLITKFDEGRLFEDVANGTLIADGWSFQIDKVLIINSSQTIDI